MSSSATYQERVIFGFRRLWWYPSVPGAVRSFCHVTQSTILCAALTQGLRVKLPINTNIFAITLSIYVCNYVGIFFTFILGHLGLYEGMKCILLKLTSAFK